MTEGNRYSHGKVYKIIDNTTGMFYIGSTALKRLDQRMNGHVNNSIKQNKTNTISKVYTYFTPENLRSERVRIILLQEVNVNNKIELLKIENEYIEKELNNVLCLNTLRSFADEEVKKKQNQDSRMRRIEEIREQDRNRYNKEERNQYNLEHYYKHKDAILKHRNEYRHENAEKNQAD